MSKSTASGHTQPAQDNALGTFLCQLYFMRHDPVVAQRRPVVKALELAICLVEAEPATFVPPVEGISL